MSDAATTSHTTPASPPADAPHQGPSDPLQSPDMLPVSVIAQRQIMKSCAVGSPLRRSPRLSCLPPPQPSIEGQDTSSDDESGSVNDVALLLSREETPENDILPPDEPSTVLANRILRAHDNPSPPPQDLAHPGVHYVPGKDGQFPSHAISAPPSPFRPINLLERLNHLSDPPFDPSRNFSTPASGGRPDTLRSSMLPPRGSTVPESRSPFAVSVPMKSAPHENLASVDTSSTQLTVDGLPPCSFRPADIVDDVGINASFQPAPGLLGHLTTITSSLNTEAVNSFSTQAVDSSLTSVIPPPSDVCPGEPLPSSGQQSCRESSPLTADTKILSSPPSTEDGKRSLVAKTTIASGEVHDGEEFLSTEDNNNPPALEQLQEGRCTKGASANSHQRLDPLSSSHSTDVLSQPIEETTLPTEQPPVTPPQTPRPSVMHPDFSRSTVQRPIFTPTSTRLNNGALEMISPVKFSFERNDICRTPAQRVPVETALARGTASYHRVLQSTESDHSQLGRFPAMRASVFTRPALNDPSRSPAKRIPVTDTTSPARGDQSQNSPTRLSLRARSASVEQRPRPILARCRSVEPCPAVTKPDSHERPKESIFPMPPVPPRPGTKLPFPLVPGQKLLSDLPPPIPEESETVETAKETEATMGRVKRDTMSQLRQPSANSRIPRIGNKPYARPPSNNGRAITTVYPSRAKAPPPQPSRKNNGVGNSNMEVSSTQPSNDMLLVGSLKRKRGAEAAAPSNSRHVMIRQVVPGMLSEKYAQKPAKTPSQVQPPSESSSPKITQPLKFRKVVDGMLSRYAPAKTNPPQPELSDSTLAPPSPLSDLSSSSNEELCDGKPPPPQSPTRPKKETSDPLQAGGDTPVVELDQSPLHRDAIGLETSSRPRRTSRSRKPTQQQSVVDVFSGSTSTRPAPARRKPQPRTEGDGFMGMSATALKVLTTSNTTKNQQTVVVLATEVIRKEGLRPESPTVKARTILQKQRDERDVRRRERTQRKVKTIEEGLGTSDTEGLGDRVSLGERADHDENDYAMPQKHHRGPGDEEDYETPERPERIIEPLRLEGADRKVNPVKQVKWHRGLSTAVYLDEVDPRPKPLPKNIVARGCLAPTSKNLPLDPLGNLVDIDNRPSPELVTEHVTVKKYLYDNDIEPAPIPVKMTRSRSKRK